MALTSNSSPVNNKKDPDFDEEAQKIFASLGLGKEGSSSRYNSCDPIWKHPRTGGTIYVGNVEAASNMDILKNKNISHVVNCTDNMPLYHQKSSSISYYRFDIASWWRHVKDDTDSVIEFTQSVFAFVGEALAAGKNVLIHCLAGAHRAGTTGCALLMHFGGLDTKAAIAVAKRLRPVIDPIGTLPELLKKIEKANKLKSPKERFPIAHFE
ncbi:hypothetical protein GUITHDRAFT_152598 [Guillardia theta CCMP2712]|uniref:protein-tyrosine-phosphatase n=2 Tax=Guillardia theta TaxID=55529 RepID=L1JC75_GUITC|nr:hypothetical protein GUITHDRAFT_152598 [Guillardia theta CCMP2712]EKX45897.1 hypothetical protein GUITHDRAFT_152598 [Guillardia theta CCMP2712]|eukprot:XP_005832877.1 hypothetical protein GUITHDRAFT_152598 [Guillardia theta CCMP2712]